VLTNTSEDATYVEAVGGCSSRELEAVVAVALEEKSHQVSGESLCPCMKYASDNKIYVALLLRNRSKSILPSGSVSFL
jgi:hypothetical protein